MQLKHMKISLTGRIKIDRKENYGTFAMSIDDVRNQLTRPLEAIQQNLRESDWRGTLNMCSFSNYDGI